MDTIHKLILFKGVGGWSPARIAAADLVGWWDGFQTPRMTLNGSSVTAIASWGSAEPLVQATGANQATLTSGETVFDGTSDYMIQDMDRGTATYVGAQTYGNGASGSTNGKGLTCTGLAPWGDGTLLVGNDGRPQSGDSPHPGACRYSADGATLISQVRIEDLVTTTLGSVQGVCVDTSDDTIWMAHTGDNRIYHVTKAWALIGYIEPGFSPNGLTYDSDRDMLISGPEAEKTLYWLDKDTGATQFTRNMRDNPDQLQYLPGEDAFWYTSGANRADGFLWYYDISLEVTSGRMVMPGADSIEGVLISGTTALINNDAYFHAGASGLNQLQTYSITPMGGRALGNRFSIAGIVRLNAIFGGSSVKACLAGDNPTVAMGIALYWVPTKGALRLTIASAAGAGNRSSADATIAAPTSKTLVFADVDMVAKTVTFYVNGVAQTPVSIPNVTLGIGAQQWSLAAAIESAAAARWSTTKMSTSAVVRDGHLWREQIEGYMAWSTGNQSILPSGHPYETRAP